MKIRSMILIIIILVIVFGLFLNYAFNKIQTVDMEATVAQNERIGDILQEYINRFYSLSDIEFINELSVFDNDVEIMFIDHLNSQAVLVDEDAYNAIDYNSLDKSIINCNNYTVYINKQSTIVVNCDEILEDPVARAIMLSYQFGAQGFETLNPTEVEYFQNLELNKMDSYLRFMMIGSLKDVYFKDYSLEAFNYYYDSWIEQLPEKRFQDIINYDYYDGIRDYLIVKVKMEEDSKFDIESYINSFINEYNIYNKDNEYKLLGLLWCLISEREGKDILNRDSLRTNRYKLLLQNTPYTDIDDIDGFKEYEENFNEMMHDLDIFIEKVDKESQGLSPIEMNLISETYDDVIKKDKNHYIYLNYVSRDCNGKLLEKNYMLIEISSYKIIYYVNYE